MNSTERAPSSIIGITMGCPVGIGPEITLKFLSSGGNAGMFSPVVLGDIGVLRGCARQLGITVPVVSWQPGQDVASGAINVLSLSKLGKGLIWGRPNRETGLAMATYIIEAINLIEAGAMAGMVTCPIAKSSLRLAGFTFPGHTEMLASQCGAKDYTMMMVGDRLRVTLLTIHIPLAKVSGQIKKGEILRLIRLTGKALQRDFGIDAPHLAVAGLNPHAGEEGLFGDEEIREIKPAVDDARAEGWQISGPLPPDTIFHRAVQGHYDAVVSMYHDQGLIPFKLLHFKDGVNVTLGLPLVRTSVDHGTAYDIAGLGQADPASLASAFRMAVQIVMNRRNYDAV